MFKFLFILIVIVSNISAQGVNSTGRDSIIMSEILVESNRLKMTNSSAPNKIQLLDENFIMSLNGISLNDALQQSDAVFVKDYGFNSGSKTISLNATQSEHTLILLNGVRLNSRQNAQVDLSLYNLDNVSRIEISKGGSSALYGSEAIGGVINIITKDPNLNKPISLNLKTCIGSYGLRSIYGKFSQNIDLNSSKSISYSLSYSDERAKNNFEYMFNNGQIESRRERENSDFNSQSFNFDLTYTPEKVSSLKLFANYSHFERGVPGIDLGYSTGSARQIDYNLISSIAFSRKLSEKLFLSSDFNYNYALQKYFDPSTFNLSVKINSYYKLNSIATSHSLSYIPSEKFNIESGGEFSFNNIVSNETEKGELYQVALYSVSKITVDLSKNSKVTFYPSVRYDFFSNIAERNVLTGKLGVNFQPLKKADFHVKSSIGNNFSAPTFNELYWKDIGNKDLRPEKSVSFDAGLYFKFTALGKNELELSYFNVNTTDRIVWTPVSGIIWRPLNIGKVNSEGIDVSLKSAHNITNKLNFTFGINYTYGSALKKNEDFPGDPSLNKQLIYLPKEMIKSSFLMNYYLTTSKILKFVSFNLFYSFNTRRYTNFENTQFIPRFDVLDGNIGFGAKIVGVDTGIKFIVNNILNENYSVLPGYPMPVRNYRFELSIKY